MSAAFLWRWRHLHGCQNPVRALISCWSSHFVANLLELLETTNSELTCLFQSFVNTLVTSASLPGKKPQPAPLPVCLSSVHCIRFSGRPEGSSAPRSDGRTSWDLDQTLLNGWWLRCAPGPLCYLSLPEWTIYLSSTSIDPSRHRWPVSVL